MMERKGQAAMEFLMTYGWAILAAIVAIGVLAYFGVFSPGRYTSNLCTIAAPFSCEEYGIGADLELVIRNGYGDALDGVNVTIDGCENGAGANLVMGNYDDVADGSIIEVNSGDGSLVFDCAPDLTNKFKGDITIQYIKDGGSIVQTASGSISGRVA